MKIIYSAETKFLYDEIKKINPNSLYFFDWDRYDSDDYAIEDLRMKINQQNLLYTYENYIIKNCDIFSKTKIDRYITTLKEIDSYNKNIIFLLESNNLDLPKEYLSFFEIKHIPKINYWSMISYIDDFIKKNHIKIDHLALIQFKSMMVQDLWVLDNELKKLYLCKDNKIDKKWIEQNINDYNNDSLFKMVEFYLKNNFVDAMKIYNESCNLKKSIDEIINVMVSYIFKLKVIYNFYIKNPRASIKTEFSLMDFQEREIKDILKYIDNNKLNTTLDYLVKLDKDIKSGRTDGYNKIKLLLLGVNNG